MANVFVEITTYKVFMYGGPNGNGGADAAISLGIPEGWAFMRFFPEGYDIPANSKVTHASGKPIYYIHYRSDQLENCIDLLRNEKPMYFFFNDTSKAAYITTSNEPVGEDEGL